MTTLEYDLFTDDRLVQPPIRKVAVIQGPQTTTFWKQAANSGTNLTSLNWNINFPINQVLNPHVRIRYFVQLDFTAALPVGTDLLQLGTNDGFCALPINSTISNYSITLNGVSVSTLPGDYVLPLLHYIGIEDRKNSFQGTPITPDQFQEYGDRLAFGSGRNVFGLYGTQTTDEFRPRGQQEIFFPSLPVPVNQNPNTSRRIQATITEPIMCLPFSWMDENTTTGLAGLQTMQLQIQTNSTRLLRMWRHDATLGVAHSAPVITFTAAPQLIYSMYTVPNTLPIPNAGIPYTYPYNTVTTLPQAYATPLTQYTFAAPIAASTGNLTLNSIQVGTIPNRFYIWVCENRTDQTFERSDFFCRINSISVQIGNETAVLSSADNYDLYQLSRQNGLQMDLEQFNRFVGGVVCLQNGKDIPFPSDDLSVGVPASVQYTFTVNFTNVNTTRNVNVEVWVAYTSPGTITFQNNAGLTKLSLLDSNTVIAVKQTGVHAQLSKFERHIPFGGGFWGDVWDQVKRPFVWAGETLGNAVNQIRENPLSALPLIAAGIGGQRRRHHYGGGILIGGGGGNDDDKKNSYADVPDEFHASSLEAQEQYQNQNSDSVGDIIDLDTAQYRPIVVGRKKRKYRY